MTLYLPHEPQVPLPQLMHRGGSKRAKNLTNSIANLPALEPKEGNDSKDDGGPMKPATMIEVKLLPKIPLGLLLLVKESKEAQEVIVEEER